MPVLGVGREDSNSLSRGVGKPAFRVQFSCVLPEPQLSQVLWTFHSPIFQTDLHVAVSFPTLMCVGYTQRTVRAPLCPKLLVILSSQSPPSFFFSIKCFLFLLPMTFFHIMPLSLLSPLALSLSPSLCSPPQPFLHLPCM